MSANFLHQEVNLTQETLLSRVLRRGTRYLIATEHGGRGYNNPIYVYEVDHNGKTAALVS